MLSSFLGLLINNWFLRTQHVVPHSLNKTEEQGKVEGKVLCTFMSQSQSYQWQLERRAVGRDSGVLVGKFNLCLC